MIRKRTFSNRMWESGWWGWIERGATVKRSVTMKLRVARMSGHFVTLRFGRDWAWETGKFEVLTSVSITVQYFGDVTLCRLVTNHLNPKVEALISSETPSISFNTVGHPRRRRQLFPLMNDRQLLISSGFWRWLTSWNVNDCVCAEGIYLSTLILASLSFRTHCFWLSLAAPRGGRSLFAWILLVLSSPSDRDWTSKKRGKWVSSAALARI